MFQRQHFSTDGMPLARVACAALARRCRRRGFALLAVLWVLVGVASLSLVAQLAGREALASARNRVALARAGWSAEDCTERARSAVGDALAEPSSLATIQGSAWATLDRVVLASPLLANTAGCSVAMHAAGSALDANTVDQEMLDRLWASLGIPAARADSVTAAFLDWRDADTLTRPLGAERSWYAAERRLPPRDGPFAHVHELRRVRGLETLSQLDSLLGVEPGRIVLERAPRAVLLALPGLSLEAVDRIDEMRARDVRIGDLLALGGALSPESRRMLYERYPDLVALTTPEPDAWILVATGTSGSPAVSATLELRLVRAGWRAAIVRRRTW